MAKGRSIPLGGFHVVWQHLHDVAAAFAVGDHRYWLLAGKMDLRSAGDQISSFSKVGVLTVGGVPLIAILIGISLSAKEKIV